MQYELILTGKFKKSLKLAKKRGLDLKLLDKVITMLQNDQLFGANVITSVEKQFHVYIEKLVKIK